VQGGRLRVPILRTHRDVTGQTDLLAAMNEQTPDMPTDPA
jgi:hypothetical protein